MNKWLISLAILGFAGSAYAANGGGSDGCGLGWEVTDKKTFSATTTRGTTNAFVPPTFGMTTGTLGCDQHDLVMKHKDAAEIAVAHQDTLRIEAAQGKGEILFAYAQAFGCDAQASADFASAAQANYQSMFPEANFNVVELISNTTQVLAADAKLASQCVKL